MRLFKDILFCFAWQDVRFEMARVLDICDIIHTDKPDMKKMCDLLEQVTLHSINFVWHDALLTPMELACSLVSVHMHADHVQLFSAAFYILLFTHSEELLNLNSYTFTNFIFIIIYPNQRYGL